VHFYAPLDILNKLVDQATHKQVKRLILKGIYSIYIAISKVLDTEKMLFFHV